jgi:hypothetical protein
VLHVPDFSGRYYSVRSLIRLTSTSPMSSRALLARSADDYIITGPNWEEHVPSGMKQILSPNNSVLVIGRVLVYSDSYLSTAYNVAKQIQVVPFSIRQPSQ